MHDVVAYLIDDLETLDHDTPVEHDAKTTPSGWIFEQTNVFAESQVVGKAGSLSVVTIQPNGSLVLKAQAQTAEGARNSVVAANGEVYLSHSKGSEIVVLTPAKK